jgi:glycerophosphoryl diester phosphodiesterase
MELIYMQKTKTEPFPSPLFQTIGHRGAGHLAPENTLKSFIMAKKLGLSWVEFDTQPCATGEWIIMHDDTLDRCSNGLGLIANTPYEVLKQLQVGKEFSPQSFVEPIPLLSETLDTLARHELHPNIEIKSSQPLTAQALNQFLEILDKHWPNAKAKPLISSFDPDILFEIQQRTQDYPLGFNIEELQETTLDIFQRGNFFSLHCDHTALSNESLKNLLKEPFPLLLYTVNDPNLAQHYFQQGVWAVFSDSPNSIAQSFIKA